MTDDTIQDHKKKASETYVEQTKLLVTLSSGMLLAPAALVAILKDKSTAGISSWDVGLVVTSDLFFIASVLCGYITVASISGSQFDGKYDIYRPATRAWSLAQFITYLTGMAGFAWLSAHVASR